MFKLHDIIPLNIEKLTYGGSGLGRHDNIVVFVPFSAPGDELEVKITKVKKRFAEGVITKIIQPSVSRLTPPCPSFGICGGCQWQHIDYQEQLLQKQKILKDILKKDGINPLPIIASKPFEYRNRIQIRALKNNVGFFQKNTHKIISAGECKIISPKLLKKVQELSKENHHELTKYELYSPNESECQVSKNSKHAESFGFSQVNDSINQHLLETAADWIKEIRPDHIYDLYCGKGNFSKFLLSKNLDIEFTGVDISQRNIDIAKSDSGKRESYFCSDVNAWLRSNTLSNNNLIIIDPPRIGCDEALLKELAKKNVKHILYISCNPTTFVRDWQRLQTISSQSYELRQSLPLDMFPQTYHFEVLSYIRLISP